MYLHYELCFGEIVIFYRGIVYALMTMANQ